MQAAKHCVQKENNLQHKNSKLLVVRSTADNTSMDNERAGYFKLPFPERSPESQVVDSQQPSLDGPSSLLRLHWILCLKNTLGYPFRVFRNQVLTWLVVIAH
ncbi:hypothetical protein TNCV_646861 [Trichonephila clavipes]|nr:hypothetical protein TNCV_646861 [Trichonephila clavipes]